MQRGARFVAVGEGRVFNVIGGDVVTCKATGADTGGLFSVFETVTPPGAGPPPHLHRREDEAFYILEGEFDFHIEGETIRAVPGAFLTAPRGVPHFFRNVGSTPGKLLIIVTPSGFENFFEEFSQLPLNAQPGMAKMLAVGLKYGIEFL